METLADPVGPAERYTEYLPIDDVPEAPRNAKGHDRDKIVNSIRTFGFVDMPVLDERTGRLVGGHGRLEALRWMRDAGEAPPEGIRTDGTTWLAPVVRGWASRSDADADALAIALNRLTEAGGWDVQALAEILGDLGDQDAELVAAAGYDPGDLEALLAEAVAGDERLQVQGDPNAIPDPPGEPVTRPGDLWTLGPHRLLCGDSTNAEDVRRVVDGATLTMLHADPPYGMGKQSAGVHNDNLYGPKLDKFQMRWWNAWLPHLADNGSAYIWGNAPDLWRLWWLGGLRDGDLIVRNEIVWDKGSAIGMRSALEHSFPCATERCLFLMRGQQFLGSQNKADFWEGYEPLRAWLEAERDRAGWTNRDVNAITGTQMAGHWFTRSQFHPISAEHYGTLQAAAAGRAFTRDYDELFEELFPEVKFGGNAHRRELSARLRAARTFFDNSHDVMRDVWEFPRVIGEERYGHATPKPVEMVERAMRSSSRPGDAVGVPFAGTGPEFIAAHRLERVAVAVELEPSYCDVICRRWQAATGVLPVRDGREHDFGGGGR